MKVLRHASAALCVAVVIQLAPSIVSANNVTISNVVMTGQDQANDFILIQFDLSWENSWRILNGDETYDAVWVFVKYRLSPATPWLHATLHTSGHTAPSGSEIVTPSDGKGFFIQRSAAGTGTFDLTGVQLRWNYGVDGLADDVENVDVEVLAIEMVYIPEGSFAAGSGGTGNGEFTLTTIDTADATVAPSGLGEFEGQAGGYPTGQPAPANANWPNGFSAFYIMKYEVSQGQYAEFLNLLTFTQQGNRFLGAAGSNRHTIAFTPPGYTASVPDRACNFLAWADGVAYTDWAGLRPMTELEFEKAARGRTLRVANEYSWGSTNLHSTAYVITDDGLPNSTVNAGSGTGNAMYATTADGLGGPLRVGVFAASTGSPTREEAGASYYGVMELSGNLLERPIGISNAVGRLFTPTHGDGMLTEAGVANVPTWPTDNADGAGFRGGSFLQDPYLMRVSDRTNALSGGESRQSYYGFRAVRSAP